MTIKNLNIFTKDFRFVPGELHISGDCLTSEPSGPVRDGEGLLAFPGLIDLHFHGCAGHEFCDGTPEAMSAIAAYQAKNGITGMAPASLTLSEETLANAFANAATYASQDGAELCGIHMEGPFFSEAKKGGQNPAYLKAPDIALFRRLQEKAQGLIKIVDVAPELEGAFPFIREASKSAVVSLAHTAADYDAAMAGFSAGATHVTHLFNAMPPFSHRAPGVVGAALDADARVELICDGIHIHPSVIRAAFRMFGEDRVILISDSIRATGLSDGTYTMGGQDITVRGRLVTLADGTICGSATNLFECVRCAVSFGIPLETALRAATFNPARELGVLDRMGTLEPGKLASFVLTDRALAIKAVYLRGKKLL